MDVSLAKIPFEHNTLSHAQELICRDLNVVHHEIMQTIQQQLDNNPFIGQGKGNAQNNIIESMVITLR
jgi:hypothetical protein